MSLAKIKAKENKGKQKSLPKLKTILANPIRRKSPTLDDVELECLQNILKDAICSSGIEAKKYATAKHINLGLESCLRVINNQQSSCVFISLSIKPNHIVSLISRNAEVKDSTQPIYAQPRLEEFTEKLFGIRALCMVLPKDLKAISEDLWNWVVEKKKPENTTGNIREIKKVKKIKNKLKSTEKDVKTSSLNTEATQEIVEKPENKSWRGDYISFSEDTAAKRAFDKKQDNEILDSFSRLLDGVPKVESKPAEDIQPMEIDNAAVKVSTDNSESDSDDFLDVYKPLTVHRIKPNPNKKPKKKRNKKKNKNIKK
ncbi:uncharacterized protein LOC106081980 [Stomoxys calcitrans]|uniref:uncharacterized protein LOC106081980 n=1 Tax=Stomoxys calcitrans TaxID=35570 RepID=UPI0027E3191E|nr:uncharacterized protein LOC106081980 [Stomoxys calcitrans]